jgi:hypothetical protein
VQVSDLFATIADLAGKPHPTAVDSVSLVPYFSTPSQPSLRTTVHAERFEPLGFGPYTRHDVAVRDAQFKLLRFATATSSSEALYDLAVDPHEQTNLLLAPLTPAAQAAYATLQDALTPAAEPWNEVGVGLGGAGGEPRLSGSGSLMPNTPVTINLVNAPPLKPMLLIGGTNWAGKLFHGGVLGPLPNMVLPPLLTSPVGTFSASTNWPAGLPAGFRLVLQAWIADASMPVGAAGSNNLLISPP